MQFRTTQLSGSIDEQSDDYEKIINIEKILRKGFWKNANNFYKFYHRDILYWAYDADFLKVIEV